MHYLQARLQLHFPTLPERAFDRALTEFRPSLLLTGTQVSLPFPELTQLVQCLAGAPELPLLDPPIYGWPALELAQYILHTSELTVRALTELVGESVARCGPRFRELLWRTAWPCLLAERVIQAHPWGLPSSPQLPTGIPVAAPPQVAQRLSTCSSACFR